jgi:hypothetical protein
MKKQESEPELSLQEQSDQITNQEIEKQREEYKPPFISS